MIAQAVSSLGSRILGDELWALARWALTRARALPLIVVLGVLSSFAESVGISLVVLFLYTAMGRASEAAAAGGPIGVFFERVNAYVSSPAWLAAIIILAIMVKAACVVAYRMVTASAQNRLGEEVRADLHRQYLEVGYEYVRRCEEGDMLNVLAVESFLVPDAYRHVSQIAIGSASSVVMLGVLFLISWPIAVLSVVGGGVLLVALNLLARPVRRLGRRKAEVNQQMAAQMLKTLQAMRTIRAFGQEGPHQHAFTKVSAEARWISVRTEQLYALLGPGSDISYLLLLAGIVALAATLSIPFAATLSCVALLYRLQAPLREVQSGILDLASIEGGLRSVAGVLSPEDKRYPRDGQESFSRLRDSIEFRRVSFQYGDAGTRALKDVSFRIQAGRTTALVGPSGAGKTTVVNLLLRLDEPDGGDILIDGRPLHTLRRKDWLETLAISGQDVELTHDTVAANIRLARADADEATLREAARLAGILDDVDAFADGMDHWIGPSGSNVSGGQRQRLGLARAIVRDPLIFILDEATSALDRELEETVRQTLRTRFKDRTVILITHRLDTVLSADHVVCLSDGCVLEEGAPGDLLRRKDGVFRHMLGADRQRRADANEPGAGSPVADDQRT